MYQKLNIAQVFVLLFIVKSVKYFRYLQKKMHDLYYLVILFIDMSVIGVIFVKCK